MRRRYATVDVFTDQPFSGNPLAVVLDAAGLSTAQMQAIASEFNYSETTFVLPPREAGHTAQVRIFTPRAELPFAGHPNVGTAFVLARETLGRGEALPESFLFEEGAGLVPVRLLRDGDRVLGAELTAPEPLSCRAEAAPDTVAACLSLTPADLCTDIHLPRVASVGLPFLIVEIATRDALRRAKPNLAAYADLFPLDGADAIYAYTRDIDPSGPEAETDLQARMFSPLDGIVEDPATGSATAAAAALLADLRGGENLTLRIGQGVDMRRPSLLVARVVAGQDGGPVTTHVGGSCVAVFEGVFDLAPDT